MDDKQFRLIMARLWVVECKIDRLEGLKPKADAVQPLVGPSETVGAVGPAALARPEFLPELKMYTKLWLARVSDPELVVVRCVELTECFEYIVQMLGKLDQGPVASTPLEEIVSRFNRDSYKSQDIDV